MNQKIFALESALNANTKMFLDEFYQLSVEELNWKPNANTWSVGQIVLHLIAVNDSYLPIIDQIGNLSLPFSAKIAFVPRMFAKVLLKSVSPKSKKKVKTFSIWKPKKENVEHDILYKFSKRKHDLVLALKNNEKHIENNTLIHSPGNKFIVYGLENAFNIIIDHEKRHFLQAKALITKHLEK